MQDKIGRLKARMQRLERLLQEYIDQDRTYNCDNKCECEMCTEGRALLEASEAAGYTMGGSASERIEQLEAEVESWKNSYERAIKGLPEYYKAKLLESAFEEDRCDDPNCLP